MATTYISIHSLRMEGDGSSNQRYIDVKHFNPLPPHGGRPPSATQRPPIFSFQSTPSAWRETTSVSVSTVKYHISIHSLRMEGDRFRQIQLPPQCHFNPLPPHGGRLVVMGIVFGVLLDFNPLPPHGGRRLTLAGCAKLG